MAAAPPPLPQSLPSQTSPRPPSIRAITTGGTAAGAAGAPPPIPATPPPSKRPPPLSSSSAITKQGSSNHIPPPHQQSTTDSSSSAAPVNVVVGPTLAGSTLFLGGSGGSLSYSQHQMQRNPSRLSIKLANQPAATTELTAAEEEALKYVPGLSEGTVGRRGINKTRLNLRNDLFEDPSGDNNGGGGNGATHRTKPRSATVVTPPSIMPVVLPPPPLFKAPSPSGSRQSLEYVEDLPPPPGSPPPPPPMTTTAAAAAHMTAAAAAATSSTTIGSQLASISIISSSSPASMSSTASLPSITVPTSTSSPSLASDPRASLVVKKISWDKYEDQTTTLKQTAGATSGGAEKSEEEREKERVDKALSFPDGELVVNRDPRPPASGFARLDREFIKDAEPYVMASIDELQKEFVVVEHKYTKAAHHRNSVADIMNKDNNTEFFNSYKMPSDDKPPTPSPHTSSMNMLATAAAQATTPHQKPSKPTTTAAASSAAASNAEDGRKGSNADKSGALVIDIRHFSHQKMTLLMSVRVFRLLSEIEPLFCTAALYDVSTRRKVTEDVHFHLNSLALLKDAKLEEFNAATIQNFSFTVTESHTGYCVVLKAFRVLRGDPEKDLSAYTKNKVDSKQAKQDLKEWVAHGGQPKDVPLQPYFWFPLFLFTKTDEQQISLQQSRQMETVVPVRGWLTDDVIYDSIDLEEPDKLSKKVKSVPGVVDVEITPLSESKDTFAVLDPSLLRVEPFRLETDTKVLKEMQDFSQSPLPHQDYINNMYIYPEALQMKHAGTNMQVTVQIVDMKQVISKGVIAPINAMYPPLYGYTANDSSVAQLLPKRATVVNWDEKYPQFGDEIKAAIPLKIQDLTIIFEFYHVNPMGKPGQQQQLLGVAEMPLRFNGWLLRSTRHRIPVYKTLQTMLGKTEKDVKDSFTFSTRLFSSVFPEDDNILFFLKESNNTTTMQDAAAAVASPPPTTNSVQTPRMSMMKQKTTSGSLRLALVGLGTANNVCLAQYFNVVMNSLFRVIARRDPEEQLPPPPPPPPTTGGEKQKPTLSMAQQAFLQIFHVLKNLFSNPLFRGTEGDNHILKSFLHSGFDPASVVDPTNCGGKWLHELITKFWLEQLIDERKSNYSMSNSSNAGESVDGPFNWFILEVISKSATVYAHSKGMLKVDNNRRQRFGVEFPSNACKLVIQLLQNFSEGAMGGQRVIPNYTTIRCVPRFITELFSLIDRGLLFTHLNSFLSTIDPNNDLPTIVTTVKFGLIKIITDYDHFIPLNKPVEPDTHIIQDVPNLELNFWQNYPLVGMILHEVQVCLVNQHPGIRLQAIKILRDILRKHYTDPRYAGDDAIQGRIATMYFPLVLMLLNNQVTVLSLDKPLQHDVLLCFVYILKYCPTKVFEHWWANDTQKQHLSFFCLLQSCLSVFETQPQIIDAIRVSYKKATSFVSLRHDQLSTSRDPVFNAIFSLLRDSFTILPRILDCSSTPSDLYGLIGSFELLVTKLPHHFFTYQGNSFLDLLCYEVLRFVGGLTSFATTVTTNNTDQKLANLIKIVSAKNYELHQNVKTFKIQMTLAASRLVGEEQELDAERLIEFMKLVTCLVEEEPSNNQMYCKTTVEQLANIQKLFEYYTRIHNTADHDTLADLYYETALRYEDSPDLRLNWLESLALKHSNAGFFEEAAQCKILGALIVARYLKEICNMALSPADFHPLGPSLATSQLSVYDVRGAQTTGQCQSNLWNLESLVHMLRTSCGCLIQAKSQELCIEVYSLLEGIFKRERNYTAVMETLAASSAACKVLIENESNREVRSLPKFFRVAFWGELLGSELNGKEFIYKRPFETNLSRMQTELKAFMFARAPNNDESKVVQLYVEPKGGVASLDSSKIYFLFSSVTPYNETATTAFDKCFGAKRFISVQAWTEEGKKAITNNIKEQRKKKTIFETDLAFPYVQTRLPIINKQETILSPIEASIEDILDRSSLFREQLEMNPPKVNALQQLLQGSVVPMVNDGPRKVCEAFMNDPQQAPALVDKLAGAMTNLLELCSAAILVDQGLIGPRQMEFHEMIEKSFNDLYDKMTKYIGPRPLPKKINKEDLEHKFWREQPKIKI